MRVISAGHLYEVASLDGDCYQTIQFVERVGAKYPGNCITQPGTTSQELLRVLIDRAEYVNNQIPCAETMSAIQLLRTAILLFEIRAKRVKGKTLNTPFGSIELARPCRTCGHIDCTEDHSKTNTKTKTENTTPAVNTTRLSA